VLQCVAVCCRTLFCGIQGSFKYIKDLRIKQARGGATHCNTLQTLQHICNTSATHARGAGAGFPLQHTATHCYTMQHTCSSSTQEALEQDFICLRAAARKLPFQPMLGGIYRTRSAPCACLSVNKYIFIYIQNNILHPAFYA